MRQTHLYYVFEYTGDSDVIPKGYKQKVITSAEEHELVHGTINLHMYDHMLILASDLLENEFNLEHNSVNPRDIIITFWSEIRYE